MNRKIALITGGSRGLGENMALKIAEKGIDVIITYNIKENEALNVVEKIKKIGSKSVAMRLNIGDIKTFNIFFDNLKKVLTETFSTDHFDFLVNNAGIGMNVPFKDTTEEQFDQLMNIQFKGVYFFTQKAMSYLNDNGSIINCKSLDLI